MGKRTKKLSIVESQVIEGYKNNMNIRELAAIHKCSPGTVRGFLVANGVQMRSKGRPKKKNDIDPLIKSLYGSNAQEGQTQE